MNTRSIKVFALSTLFTLPFFSPLSHSAAFGVAEQSALGLGNAFAGGAASAEDASTIWFNPAGMTRIKGNQMVLGMHFIAPSFDFDDDGSTNSAGASNFADGSEDGGRFAYVPNFYYVHSLDNDVKVGVGINSPFGLATKYGADWIGKYQAIESEIVTVNINPSVAWKATTNLSLGFGISIQYIEATLNNKVDFSVLGAIPDGFSHLEADDISYGFNLGALYNITNKTRIGLSYRSEIKHDFKGDADFRNITSALNLDLVLADTHLDVQPDLPASASLSIHHQWNDSIDIMADATWVGWSSVPALVIMFDNPLKADSTDILRLKDNIRLSLGATYSTEGPWTYRIGAAYDEGAARNASSRSSRFPDNDRYWLAIGASYQLADNLSLDASYAHLFVPDTKINRSSEVTGLNPAELSAVRGDYESDADIISVQLRWDM
ncbi:OmpP1/FadL family transporter [Cycloclasticus pugetii]|uniref:OmpP1/FadL family transporter n=1 Tax=Cycloclasticus pugetii TaxID=34068 RepID=UPI002409A5A8|nr:porin [Cycloclasticus pugetii]MDF1829074.1 outer membrane protein transport protein [Cycloclasticus pugetii]